MPDIGKSVVFRAEYDSSSAFALCVHCFPCRFEIVGFGGDGPVQAMGFEEVDTCIVSKIFREC
jgi:hypothetical protein